MISIKKQYQIGGIIAITAISIVGYTEHSTSLCPIRKEKLRKLAGAMVVVSTVNSHVTAIRCGIKAVNFIICKLKKS